MVMPRKKASIFEPIVWFSLVVFHQLILQQVLNLGLLILEAKPVAEFFIGKWIFGFLLLFQ